MIVGVPKEIKADEYRVAMLPVGVEELTGAGHTVLLEAGAGMGSGIADAHYTAVGATLVEGPSDLKDMLKRLDAKDRSRRRALQTDCTDVLDTVNAGAWSHVAAHIRLASKHRPEVGIIDLAFNLVRTELVNRAGTVECLGDELTERLVVVTHRWRSSLSPRNSPDSPADESFFGRGRHERPGF